MALLALASCNGYLDRTSKTQMNDENFWTSESNLRYFVNLAYPTYFVGYNSSWGTAYIPGVRGEISDDATKTGMQDRPIEEQKIASITVDTHGETYPEPNKLPDPYGRF